jgi:hypothetical protein
MQKLRLVDVLNDILHMDRDALDRVISAVKMRRDQLHFTNTKTFKTGDRVEFTSSRTGTVLAGTVSRVKIKYVAVNCDNGQSWNIPGGMLRPAQQKVMA